MAQVIIVGGGLSGLSAAHTVLEQGVKVVVIDKNSFLGGNSTKATSGINGTLTKTQIAKKIDDSPEKFYQDTVKSARDLVRPGLAKVLTYNSGSAVDWLQEKFNLDLSLVSQLGGHSYPRTHRGKERFPGMTITYALMEKLEAIVSKQPDQARIIKKACVTRLLTDNNGAVIGVEYELDGKKLTEHGPVIIATGGYGADFSDGSLLKKYRPDICHLATTNGDHTTGDGVKMSEAIGANLVDMKQVQVHPTGLVDPAEPDSKIKFLAAEALRGVGGLLLDNAGDRFADELGHRDYVTGKMWERNKGPYRLVLNKAGAKEIEWHCKHYVGRGLMKKYATGADLAKDMGISTEKLNDTYTKYNEIAKSKNDPFGKKFFHNMPFDIKDEFHVAIVCPVIHYCMGGVETSPASEIVHTNGKPIPGLYAAGEVSGGVHGANRLGGSSLLDCVVFGRVSGENAAKYSSTVPNLTAAARRIASVKNHVAPIRIEVHPSEQRVTIEVSWGSDSGASSSTSTSSSSAPSYTPAPSSSSSSSAAPAAAAPAPEESKKSTADRNKVWTKEEVAKHNNEKDCWVIVNGQVLDVTHFLKDHPGGKKAILIFAGKDATEEFNMLHQKDVVEKYAPESIIGVIKS